MAEQQRKVHFYMSMKSVMDFPTEGLPDAPIPTSIHDKVRPQGDFYFINQSIPLQEDDWVIFGVASTDNIDLQNETIDAKEVFGDYLEEFVTTGRVFYEHGYRYAKDASPTNRIDEPIGRPYMVEIFDNKLWFWAVLDKSHPLAQKVWESLSGTDPRFRNKWGFSIGGILVGKPQATTTSLYGRVNRLPKMRLYEISVTPQPVNPYTWAQVVKSLVSEDSVEHTDNAEQPLHKETVDVKPDDTEDIVNPAKLDFGDDYAEGSPPAERKPGDETVNVTKAIDDEEKKPQEEEQTKTVEEEGTAPNEAEESAQEDSKEQDVLADALEKAAGQEGQGEGIPEDVSGQPKDAEDVAEPKPAEESEATPQAAPQDTIDQAEQDAGGQDSDDSVLVDLLGEDGEEENKAEEGGDASIELILDEISSLREVVDGLTERLNKLLEVEAQESSDELSPETETTEDQTPHVSEEVLAKSLDAQLQLMDAVEFLRTELDSQKSMLQEVVTKLANMPVVTPAISEDSTTKSVAQDALAARATFDPNAEPVTKSVGDTAVQVEVEPERANTDVTKSLADTVEDALQGTNKSKFERILQDKSLLEVAKSLATAYTELDKEVREDKLSYAKYRDKTAEIITTAKSVLGLTRAEFLTLVNEG